MNPQDHNPQDHALTGTASQTPAQRPRFAGIVSLRTLLPLAVLLVLLLVLLSTAPSARAAGGGSVVVQWDNAGLQAIRDTHPAPTIVSRGIAILHTCLYDAWAAYDQTAVGTRLGGTLRRPPVERTLANKNKALSFAAYRALADLFPQPAEVAKFQALMTRLGCDPADLSTDPSTPAGVGNLAAQAVLDFRHSDGANQLGDLHPGPYSDYTGYAPVNTPDKISDPNRWQPLRLPDGHGGVTVQRFATPFWGRILPFALTSGAQFRPLDGPFKFPSGRYRAQAEQILHDSADLTDEQKMIAEYWADGPNSELPPGHWCLFSQFVSQRDEYSLDDDVKLFFAVCNADLDAGIAAWDAKSAYDSVRPLTSIHFLFAGQKVRAWAGPYQGTRLIDGADWQPYQPVTVVTPPFAEYVSGHSTFSAACAEVLLRFTGRDTFGASVTLAAGSSRVEPGLTPAQDVTLSWATFSDAADQAGLSRRYGGIHFENGDITGRQLGRLVGAQVWAKATTYFQGTAR